MSNTLLCTIKKSIKRSIWQIKDSVSHEQVVLHGMGRQLDAAVASIGGDPSDPMVVWYFQYSPERLADPTFRMELMEDRGERLVYRIALGPTGTSGTEGWFPRRLFSPWPTPPSTLWISIQRAESPDAIFLSPLTEAP